MDNQLTPEQKLAEAVAALLDDNADKLTVLNYKNMLANEPHCSYLAFECHKALKDEALECLIHGFEYKYGEACMNGFDEYFSGIGDTDEEAIFSAVLDWHRKGGAA